MAKKHEEKKHEAKGKHEHKAKHHKRANGGKMFVEKGEGENEGEEGMKMHKAGKPAHMPRKSGGHVNGKAAMARPDRRARGGATSDKDPLTSAGKMTSMPFEAKQAPKEDTGGKGPDRD